MIKNLLKRFVPSSVIFFIRTLRFKLYERKINHVYNLNFKILKRTQNKIKEKERISIGFYVVYDASWGARPIFEKLLNRREIFDVSIVVCPDVSRGKKNEVETINKVYSDLCKNYGAKYVLNSYDRKSNKYIDYSNLFDIISIANPYDKMTHRFYRTEYLITKKKKLVFFNAYGYQGKLRWDIHLMKEPTYNMFWKFYVDNEATKELANKYQIIHGDNIVVSGSCKMDNFMPKEKENKRKCIILAPHHSVQKNENGLNLSNFLQYSELFQELPKKYKEIDFIFRPHPLLFTTLKSPYLWGEQKVNSYIERMKKNPNVTYSTEGNYLDIFNQSDAMIDDCGSFLAEYFYTNKPQCYMLQSEEQYQKEYIDFGKSLFDYIYKAFNEQDIYHFIDEIVIEGKDVFLNSRKQFSKDKIMVNHTHVAEFVIDDLSSTLGVK